MRQFLIVIALLLSLFDAAYAQFSHPQHFGPWNIDATDVKDIDYDEDGDIDVLFLTSSHVSWFQNLGNAEFGAVQTIYEFETPKGRIMDLGDVDNDGDLDIVVGDVWDEDEEINILVNDGTGMYQNQQIAQLSNGIRSIKLSDLDNDGDLECLYGLVTTGAFYLENLGELEFAEPVQFESTFGSVNFIDTHDVNGDGYLDVIGTHGDNGFYLRNVVDSLNFDYVFWSGLSDDDDLRFQFLDIDNDGDEDYIPTNECSDETYWYEKDEDAGWNGGYFTREIGNFEVNGIETSCRSLQVSDIDGDGDLDLLISFEQSGGDYKGLYWSEFSNGQFALPIQPIDETRYYTNLECSDFNGDGKEDILCWSTFQDHITFYLHNGVDGFLESQELTTSVTHPAEFKHFDFDQDGLSDLMSSATGDGKISWYKNLGQGVYSDQNVLVENRTGIYRFWPLDIDNDGDLDLLWYRGVSNTLSGSIGWNENDGVGNYDSGDVLIETSIVRNAVFPADIDGDGDQDIVFSPSANSDADLMFLMNIGNGQFVPIEYNTDDGILIWDICLMDVDGDNDLDILVSDLGGAMCTLVWLENTGTVDDWTVHNIGTRPYANISETLVEDFDNDGDLDFALTFRDDVPSISEYYLELLWNEGDGEFVDSDTLYGGVELLINNLKFFDVEGDGLKDIVSRIQDEENESLAYFRQIEEGVFEAAEVLFINEHAMNLRDVFDIDRDGDMDLLMIEDGHLRYAENLMFVPKAARGLVYLDENQNGVKDSLDPGLSFIQVSSSPQSEYAFTYDDGGYQLSFNEIENGVYEISPSLPEGWVLTSLPEVHTVEVTDDFTSVDSLNFGCMPDSIFTSWELSFVPGFPRCNTVMPLYITINNIGTTTGTGIVELDLDTASNYLWASEQPDSIVENKIYWHFESLAYFESLQFEANVQIPGAEYIGTELQHFITVYEDLGSFSDSSAVSQLIQCSFDPNDKSVSPAGVDSQGYIQLDQELTYLIRFQNTGTDTAFNVIIDDYLASELDYTSFDPIASSHPMQVHLQNDGHVEFAFYNIMLPDSGASFEGSQGFVQFRISPLADLNPNTSIENSAEIFFDYNSAIYTNTVLSTIECYISPTPFITFNYPFLQAGDNGESYQWYLNGEPIPNSNMESVEPESNGLFSVEIWDSNGCSTISEVFEFSSLGDELIEIEDIAIYPVPSSDLVYLEVSAFKDQDFVLRVFDSNGREVHSGLIRDSVYSISKNEIGVGLFLISLTNSKGDVVKRGKIITR